MKANIYIYILVTYLPHIHVCVAFRTDFALSRTRDKRIRKKVSLGHTSTIVAKNLAIFFLKTGLRI